MRVFPSIAAAILAGFVATPVMIIGRRVIEQETHNQILMLCWTIIAFFVPVYFATVDRDYLARHRRERGFFGSFIAPASMDAFRMFYLPTWLRMGLWFISSAASMFGLKLFGVRF